MIKRTRGFTLIELLVVVAIIGLLSSVVISSLNVARAKGRDAQRALNIKQLKTALELYYGDNNTYPKVKNAGWGYAITDLAPFLTPKYIATIPTDPSGKSNQYVWGTNQYGLLIYTEKTNNWCRTGVNVNTGWWGNRTTCPF